MPHAVSVQSFSLPLPGLRRSLHLVQLTDLHFGWVTPLPRLVAAVEQVNALSPDLVALTGDVASWWPGSVRQVARTLGALSAPRVAVLGNHDHHVGAARVRGALQDAGFVVLQNASVAVGGLTLVGVDDPVTGHDDVLRAVEGVEGPRIGLVHDPKAAPRLWAQGVPLVLAGHTHGGHFDIGRWPERLLGSPFIGGLYPTPQGTVYVCPGLGSATFRWRYGPRSQPALGSLSLLEQKATG